MRNPSTCGRPTPGESQAGIGHDRSARSSREERFTLDPDPDGPRKIAGGYALVPAWRPIMAWWLYRTSAITLRDLRTFLAILEQVERRCRVRGAPDATPKFSVAELAQLVTSTPKCVKQSLRALDAVGLVAWSRDAIIFAPSPECVRVDDLGGFWQMMARVENSSRRLPIPRRILRVLARLSRPALIATVLGHLLRCLYATRGSGGRFDRRARSGRCKASWIAGVFGIDETAVKRARAILVHWKWLTGHASPQWVLNQRGRLFSINPRWNPKEVPELVARAAAPPSIDLRGGPGSPPPPADSGPVNPPPIPLSNQEALPPEESFKNQEHAPGGQNESGACIHQGGEEKTLPDPTMADIRIEDLKRTDRLLDLFLDAVNRGMAHPTEHDRREFVAAAEHALSVGDDPVKLFASIVRRGLWKNINQGDEDAARDRLRHRDMDVREAECCSSPPMQTRQQGPAPLSDDARMLESFRAAIERAYSGKPGKPSVRAVLLQSRGWTAEQYEAADMELKRAAAAQAQRNYCGGPR